MGAYENPKLIIQDHLAFQRAFDAKMQPALESYAKAVEAKKLREEEAERLLQQRIDVTTAGLYGTIENLGRSSQATKDNIKNNVNEFVMYAQDNKLTANQLMDFKNNWKNSTDPYNALLNESISKGVTISKGHEHYDEYVEMITAVKNGAIFDNKFNRDTGNFEGQLTYEINGQRITKSTDQINAILNSVAGAEQRFNDDEKAYNDTIFDDRSVMRTLVNNELDKIFNEAQGYRGATEQELNDILDTSYQTYISGDEELQKHIWYNKMSEADKVLSYKDTNGDEQTLTIDWKLTDEHFYKIADANSDGKLSEEELKVQSQLLSAREDLVKKYVVDQLRFGADSRRIRHQNSKTDSEKLQKAKSDVAFIVEDLNSIDIALIKDPNKMGPETADYGSILSNIQGLYPDVTPQDASSEQKKHGYNIWMAQKLNSNSGKDIIWFTGDQAKRMFMEDKQASTVDELSDQDLEKLWLESDTYKKKVTNGDAALYYMEKKNGVTLTYAIQEYTKQNLLDIVLRSRNLTHVRPIINETTPL